MRLFSYFTMIDGIMQWIPDRNFQPQLVSWQAIRMCSSSCRWRLYFQNMWCMWSTSSEFTRCKTIHLSNMSTHCGSPCKCSTQHFTLQCDIDSSRYSNETHFDWVVVTWNRFRSYWDVNQIQGRFIPFIPEKSTWPWIPPNYSIILFLVSLYSIDFGQSF